MKVSIVFDLDGTLLDTVPDIATAANRMLEGLGVAPLPVAVAQGFIGNGIEQFVVRCLAETGLTATVDKAAALAAFRQNYSAGLCDLTRPYPGVVPALRALKDRGFVLGVCTNKEGQIARSLLQLAGMSDAFDAVIGGGDHPLKKPDPAPLALAFEQLGGPGTFVGDSEVDGETARRAGVPFVFFTGGYCRVPADQIVASAHFDHFDQLAGLI